MVGALRRLIRLESSPPLRSGGWSPAPPTCSDSWHVVDLVGTPATTGFSRLETPTPTAHQYRSWWRKWLIWLEPSPSLGSLGWLQPLPTVANRWRQPPNPPPQLRSNQINCFQGSSAYRESPSASTPPQQIPANSPRVERPQQGGVCRAPDACKSRRVESRAGNAVVSSRPGNVFHTARKYALLLHKTADH